LQLNASTGELTGNTSQGSVTFQLWANNAVGAGDPVTIVIATGETSAQRSWQVEFFGADADDPTKEATVWGDLADPDGDNWINLLEFVMGLNPLQSDSDQGPRLFFRAGAPVIQLRRRIGLQDHTFRLERSSHLAQWSEVAELNEVTIAADGMAEIVEWSPPFSADQSFYRIMILNNAGTSTGNAQ
jgi:hypothetical protein